MNSALGLLWLLWMTLCGCCFVVIVVCFCGFVGCWSLLVLVDFAELLLVLLRFALGGLLIAVCCFSGGGLLSVCVLVWCVFLVALVRTSCGGYCVFGGCGGLVWYLIW